VNEVNRADHYSVEGDMNLRSDHEGYDDESAAGAPSVASGPSRRTVLRGIAVAGAVGLGGAVLAGCGSDGDGARNTTTGPANGNGSSADGGEGGGGGTGAALASTADIPEGGGTIFADEKVVVTQPTAGEFLGFSAVCTHQACTLATVEGGTINCPCHGSRFSIEDGSVQNGPATRPLPKVNVKVEADQVVRG